MENAIAMLAGSVAWILLVCVYGWFNERAATKKSSATSDEAKHRIALQENLTPDELLLCDTEREKILVSRELVSVGALRMADLYGNESEIERAAKDRAFRRNNFGLVTWWNSLDRWQKVLLSIVLILVAIACVN